MKELTERQAQIYEWGERYVFVSDIAEALGVSQATVRAEIEQIRQKGYPIELGAAHKFVRPSVPE